MRIVDRLRTLARSPMVHFLLLGLLAFGLHNLRHPHERDLLGDVRASQAELTWLKDNWINQYGRVPNARELHVAAERYIEEEMRYREAARLGLDVGDDIIRRRMIQKFDFIYGVSADVPDDDVLRAHFEAHRDRFAAPFKVSFCHAYFAKRDNRDQAFERANAVLKNRSTFIHKTSASIDELGDPFPRQACYEDATLTDITRDFGLFFANAISQIPIDTWAGPVESGLGFHVVLISARSKGGFVPFESARQAVLDDWLSESLTKQRLKTNAYLMKRYDASIDEKALARLAAPGPAAP